MNIQAMLIRRQNLASEAGRRCRRILFHTIGAAGIATAVVGSSPFGAGPADAQPPAERLTVNLLAELAASERVQGHVESALRLAIHAARLDLRIGENAGAGSWARSELATALFQSRRTLVPSSSSHPAFSPEGTRVVADSKDGTVHVFDAVTGTEVAVLQGENSLRAISPDGAQVVTASWDSAAAHILDIKTGKEIAALRGHSHSVYCAAFNPEGSRIVTGSKDNTARLWDATTFKELAVLNGHSSFVWRAAFRHDGLRIVTSSYDHTARIWDVETGKEVEVLRGHNEGLDNAVFSRDDSRILTASRDGTGLTRGPILFA